MLRYPLSRMVKHIHRIRGPQTVQCAHKILVTKVPISLNEATENIRVLRAETECKSNSEGALQILSILPLVGFLKQPDSHFAQFDSRGKSA